MKNILGHPHNFFGQVESHALTHSHMLHCSRNVTYQIHTKLFQNDTGLVHARIRAPATLK